MLFIEEIHMNNTVAIICSKMQNLEQILNESLKKMLTESCVMFFLPSRAVFSSTLRDEYLTSAVRTEEGAKAGSNQPPARDPVQLKLELTPNYLISHLKNTGSRSTRYPIRMRAQSFQNFSTKAILKLQDQLSQHDRCKNLNQRHLRYARGFKSTNQRIATE